ncbi:MAG: hypothetical protein GY883_16565 [Shimia sp.]|nr:hypothetical protein [Shimia sp.]
MLGVVLWHDQKSNRALIWCEDQGDLAYFSGAEGTLGREFLTFGKGDLVRFDVKERCNRRYVSNPMPVDRSFYTELPDILRDISFENERRGPSVVGGGASGARHSGARGSNVVPFPLVGMAMSASK